MKEELQMRRPKSRRSAPVASRRVGVTEWRSLHRALLAKNPGSVWTVRNRTSTAHIQKYKKSYYIYTRVCALVSQVMHFATDGRAKNSWQSEARLGKIQICITWVTDRAHPTIIVHFFASAGRPEV